MSRDERMITCPLIELRSNSGCLEFELKVCSFWLSFAVEVKSLNYDREDARAPKRFGGSRSWETAHAIIHQKQNTKPCSPTTHPLHSATPIESIQYPHHIVRHCNLIPAPTHRHHSLPTLLQSHTPTQWPRDTVWTTREIPAHGSRYLISAVHSAWEYVGNTQSA
jgi:hypothetical protein